MRQSGGDYTHEAAAFLPLTEDNKVDARSLHGWLGVGRDFSNWMRKLVTDYAFEEGLDYSPVLANIAGKRGKPRKDYLLTLDTAKQVALIVNTPRGRATRLYFIAAEKAAVRMAAGEVEAGGASSRDIKRAAFSSAQRRAHVPRYYPSRTRLIASDGPEKPPQGRLISQGSWYRERGHSPS